MILLSKDDDDDEDTKTNSNHHSGDKNKDSNNNIGSNVEWRNSRFVIIYSLYHELSSARKLTLQMYNA